MQVYCVKRRQKREVKDPTPVTMKNGRPAVTGPCAACGTRMFRIGAAEGAGAE